MKLWLLAALAMLIVISPAYGESGIASVYMNGDGYAGKKTANGERGNPSALTAAHRTLAFNTRVLVTNVSNGKTVVLRISDRGPFIKGRIIDVTPAGESALGFSGLTKVTVEIVP